MSADDDNRAKAPVFLTVEQCRQSLPIQISRKEVIRYIKAAGPDFYQEHRRQIFLTPEQWTLVVKTMRPKEVGRRRPSAAELAYQKALEAIEQAKTRDAKSSAEEAFPQMRAQLRQRATEKTAGRVSKRILPGPEAYRPKHSK
jgi:hypothetical protein